MQPVRIDLYIAMRNSRNIMSAAVVDCCKPLITKRMGSDASVGGRKIIKNQVFQKDSKCIVKNLHKTKHKYLIFMCYFSLLRNFHETLGLSNRPIINTS